MKGFIKYNVCFLLTINMCLLLSVCKETSSSKIDVNNSTSIVINTTANEVNSSLDVTNSRTSTEVSADKKNEVMEYIYKNIPEILVYEDYIEIQSNNEATLFVDCDNDLKQRISNDFTGNYYLAYVGEDLSDNKVIWEYFYVNEDLNEVLWYDFINLDLGVFQNYPSILTLEDWRNDFRYGRYLTPGYLKVNMLNLNDLKESPKLTTDDIKNFFNMTESEIRNMLNIEMKDGTTSFLELQMPFQYIYSKRIFQKGK